MGDVKCCLTNGHFLSRPHHYGGVELPLKVPEFFSGLLPQRLSFEVLVVCVLQKCHVVLSVDH